MHGSLGKDIRDEDVTHRRCFEVNVRLSVHVCSRHSSEAFSSGY
jgi:hypothetical protein